MDFRRVSDEYVSLGLFMIKGQQQLMKVRAIFLHCTSVNPTLAYHCIIHVLCISIGFFHRFFSALLQFYHNHVRNSHLEMLGSCVMKLFSCFMKTEVIHSNLHRI